MVEWVVMSDHGAMSKGLGEFLARSIPGEWVESRQGAHVTCVLHSELDGTERLAWPMARTLAQYFLYSQERDWVTELLARRYQTFDLSEQRQIVDDVIRIIHSDSDQDVARLDLATTVIYSYAKEHSTLVAEGIRTFLMSDIRMEFDEAIDQAVDIFLLEQEYQEFVRLLKQLVSVAGSQHEWIHVRFQSERFFFEDASGKRLGDELINDMLVGIEHQIDALGDVLISALVTLAPKRITIHQGQLLREGRNTLIEVFDQRILFCHGCARCYSPQVDSDRRSF